MRATATASLFALILLAGTGLKAQTSVLKSSDVVFMYQATPAIYKDYGATVLAWGGTPTPETRAENRGLKVFGSVGMVTEFARYCRRFPDTYEQGLCRDVEGKPFKVPWLTDQNYKGIPYWWCCTRQPLFRQYISERVVETVKAGADGVHIDDHLGTAGALWDKCCLCDRCVAGFRAYLAGLPPEELRTNGIADPASYNYREVLRDWLSKHKGQRIQNHPLWPLWRIYQLRGAAEFMGELRELAARTAGHPVPMSANAGLMWGPHLNDYRALDCFSAEIEHHASEERFNDEPLLAYRLADAVGRPLAATASGGDWAYIKAHHRPGLVQGWIALSYAAGGFLMAPNRQWCYTPELGTHWYEGPAAKFAPLYRFVREHRALFDGYHNYADVTVAFSYHTFDRDAHSVVAACSRLAAANISYRIALGYDPIARHALPGAELRLARRVLVLAPSDFVPFERVLVDGLSPERKLGSVEQAVSQITPAVTVKGAASLRVLPRVKRGSAVIHLVNRDYDPAQDAVRPVKNLRLRLDLGALGVVDAKQARIFAPGKPVLEVPLEHGTLTVPELNLWSVVELGNGAS